ncbi:maleylpyruvate isomerase family mycothiol-dependent enzyme [Brevibacterium metallidurans]|uniref:TIGR03086 family metal-binding protein n=1 Tax=Brevibacterium metallidurans TaxID=1482676 RepID=A0ABN0SS63_9MICO
MAAPSNKDTAEDFAVFASAAAYALDALSAVENSDFERPTPCADWNVRDIALHLADVSDAILDYAQSGTLTAPTPRPEDTPEPTVLAQERITAVIETLTNTTTSLVWTVHFPAAARAAANEFAAHGWDINSALGTGQPVPEATATALLAFIDGCLGEEERRSSFAPAIPLASTACPSDRFLAYLGRQPS